MKKIYQVYVDGVLVGLYEDLVEAIVEAESYDTKYEVEVYEKEVEK